MSYNASLATERCVWVRASSSARAASRARPSSVWARYSCKWSLAGCALWLVVLRCGMGGALRCVCFACAAALLRCGCTLARKPAASGSVSGALCGIPCIFFKVAVPRPSVTLIFDAFLMSRIPKPWSTWLAPTGAAETLPQACLPVCQHESRYGGAHAAHVWVVAETRAVTPSIGARAFLKAKTVTATLSMSFPSKRFAVENRSNSLIPAERQKSRNLLMFSRWGKRILL